ncbi:ABC transporter substrate-binding protein [Leucobacter sp. HY1910]
MKRTLTAASALAAAALALTACAGGGGAAGGDAAATAPTELKIGNFLDLVSWDPSIADIGFNGPYLSAVYDPLVALNGDGEPVPALATDWEISDDALTITLNLRDDATFSNGEAFNADVAVANLEFLKEGVTSREAYLNVDSFEAIDDDTVEIHMNERDDRLLYFMGLGRSYMAAPEAIEAGTLVEAPVGSGPYTLSDTTIPGAEYHFDRVDGHWAEDEFPFDTVSVLPLQDPSARNNAMEAGQINVAFADATALELAEQNNWNVAEKVAAWAGIRINDHTGKQLKPLGDVRVRQALNLAFDGQAMLDAVGNGLGVYTNQVFAAGYPGYDEELNRAAGANIEEAKKLLAEAGYADGFDVTLPMAPGFQPWQATVEQAFKDLGLRLKWDEYQMADYQANAGNYPMFLVSLAVDAEPVATIARQLTVPQWYMPEPDISEFPELQGKIDEALAAPRGDEQNEKIRELNAMLVEEAWFVPWYQSKNVFVTDAGIELEPVTGMMFPTLRQIQPAK